MLAKMIFVLVILATDGTAQRFATFESMDQCETFARSYNVANQGFGRAACVPENQQASVDMKKDFDAAMVMMEMFMDHANRMMEQQKRKEM